MPFFSDGYMWRGTSLGWHLGMIGGPIFLYALVGGVALLVWLIRSISHGPLHPLIKDGFDRGGRRNAALDFIEERFARGEIDKDEFKEKRELLAR